MSCVEIINVSVLDNPTKFTNPFQFEVLFSCNRELPYDLEWKIVYVGSAESDKYDQTLDSVLVSALVGLNKFVFQADPPKTNLIPDDDILGVTVVLLTCSYCSPDKPVPPPDAEGDSEMTEAAPAPPPPKQDGGIEPKEFIRVGYYVSNSYEDEELNENPPDVPDISKIRRTILADEPRVTRFLIDWD